MSVDWDCSIPSESAERRLNVKPGSMGLNALAQRMSARFYPDEMISIRDRKTTPQQNSGVYLAGHLLADRKPYNVAKGFGVQV